LLIGARRQLSSKDNTMMFNKQRQSDLEAALTALRLIPGISSVESDDFNSSAVNVFLTLAPLDYYRPPGSPVYHFVHRINVYKAKIKKALHNCGTRGAGFNFLDWPVKRYSSNGTINGKPLKFDEGYNHRLIKIEVII
jgi:hypothetical protein